MPQNIFTGRFAEGYDLGSSDMYEPRVLEPTVSFLADAARDGAALEFGIGTGRVALPLSQRGVEVHGVDISPDLALCRVPISWRYFTVELLTGCLWVALYHQVSGPTSITWIDFVLQALFAKYGYSEKFAEYLNIPDNEGKAIALVQGRAAAALFAPPTDRPLLKAGFKRLIYMGDEFKNVPFSALQAMAKQIQAEPDMTERMVKAVMKALYWIRANREGSIDIIMKNGRLDQRDIAASLYDLMRDAYIPGLSPEGLYKRAELEFAVLKEKPNFKPEQFIDDRFYKAALKALANEPGAKP